MPLALLLALALWPFHGPDPAPARHQRVAGWVVETHRDRFTGHLTCQVHRGRVSVARKAVIFHFPVRIDTFDAAYRIDGGPLWRARDDAAELASMGFRLHDDDSLDNPSGGIVRIPAHRLEGAQRVRIEAAPYAKAYQFALAGLDGALDVASNRGCDSIGEPER